MEERVHNGVTYRRSGPGQPWVRVGGGTIIPKSGASQQKEGADADRARSEADIAAAEARIANDRLRAELAKTQADAANVSANATKTATEIAAAPTPATPEVKAARNVLATDAIIDKLATARRQIGDGWSTGNVTGTSLFQNIPFAGQNSADLAATLEGITGSIINDTLKDFRAQSATGASGFGSLTEREAQRLGAAVASMRQTQSEEALLANLATVEKHYRNLMALKNNEDPTDPAVAERYGIMAPGASPPPSAPPSGGVGMEGAGAMGRLPPEGPSPFGPDATELTADGRMVADPALAGANATVTRMIREGRSEDEIRAYLNRLRPGLGNQTNSLRENIEYYNQNPNFTPQVDIEQVWEPASGFNQAMGEAAQWEDPLIGFSPGAATIGAGDMFSFGTLDNFADNPDMARAVMKGVQQENPASFLGGQIAGGVASGLGAEAALGRAGLGTLGRMRGGDLAIGSGYGAGSADDPNDSRLGGAAVGGLFGLAAGAAGRTVVRGIGRAVQGVTDPARRALAEAKVPMTVGQLLGGTAKSVEDRLTSTPLVGGRIIARRQEGVEGFNRAMFDEGLAPVAGTTGGAVREAGVDAMKQARGQAYRDALDGVSLARDPQFDAGQVALIGAAQRLPSEMAAKMAETLPRRVFNSFDSQGNLSGNAFQQSIRGLRIDAKALKNEPFYADYAQVSKQAEDLLEGLLQRQNPTALSAFRDANALNRNFEVIRDAVNRARNGARSRDPGMVMPSQLADAAAANSRLFGNTAGTSQQPFFNLSRAGQNVLPSNIGDSGTAGRMLLPLTLMSGGGGYATSDEGEGLEGAGTGLAAGAVIAALLSGPYGRGSRDAIARALLAERNPTVNRIGQEIIENDRIAGLLATVPLLTATQGQW